MGSKRPPKPTVSISRPDRSLLEDDRAIEGLPIRLVIALIIGVVSLGIMLQILGSVGTFETNTEVDVDFHDENYVEEDGTTSFELTVLDEDGEEVPEATVIATGGSARMDTIVEETDEDGVADFDFENEGNLELPPDADTGTIEFEIQPRTDSNWEDSEPNNELIVVAD